MTFFVLKVYNSVKPLAWGGGEYGICLELGRGGTWNITYFPGYDHSNVAPESTNYSLWDESYLFLCRMTHQDCI